MESSLLYIDDKKIESSLYTNNRAFLYGDSINIYFWVYRNQLILFEETYFFLIASMRKMKMKIPISFTLEYLQEIFQKPIQEINHQDFSRIEFTVFRNSKEASYQSSISFSYSIQKKESIFNSSNEYKIDILKDLTLNTNFLNNILVHCPENIFAEIFAEENDLNDVIMLNFNKRIARSATGNFLFLSDKNEVFVPKLSEGAILSVFTNSFLSFIEEKIKISVIESEIIPFETQKMEEILVVSDFLGIHGVSEIRNKKFSRQKFSQIVSDWQLSILP